ncbi:MAG: hypothetical protein RL518_1285 [Pseudomonadota bacterium]|jgi:hypothetical protein
MVQQIEMKAIDSEARLGWQAAEELLRPFGSVAANFAEAIRLLVHHYEAGSARLPLAAENHIIRLLKNSTIKATYYFLTKEHRPHVLTPGKLIDAKEFFEAYSPFEHAVILSYCYLSRTLSRKTDKDDWAYVENPLYEALTTGAIIGQGVPEVGLAFGLLSRGLRYLAFAPFLRENRRGFKDYRIYLKSKDLAFDIAYEENAFQTNNIQIAAIILERMGFNHAMALDFVAAATGNKDHTPSELYGIPLSAAEALLDSYMETGEILERTPAWTGRELVISVQNRGAIMTKLNKVMSSRDRNEWLSKGSSSINPEQTPELFVGT